YGSWRFLNRSFFEVGLLNGSSAANASISGRAARGWAAARAGRGRGRTAGAAGRVVRAARRLRCGGAFSRGRRRPPGLEPFVEIAANRSHQRFGLGVKEMVGAGHDLLLDDDALLRL